MNPCSHLPQVLASEQSQHPSLQAFLYITETSAPPVFIASSLEDMYGHEEHLPLPYPW